MPEPKQSPIRPTNDEARALARNLIISARFGALGVLEPKDGFPMVTRVAIGTAPDDGSPITLISSLSAHTQVLKHTPHASLLLGEPKDLGDPLTHPRITLQCQTNFIDPTSETHKKTRQHYLLTHPKSKLYIDFADFCFVRFSVQRAYLNGGFGKAFQLTAADLTN
ncbi:MAG: pyridoxamine 5'-phosphate oxidase family protein [Pseudoruegeria sp.]